MKKIFIIVFFLFFLIFFPSKVNAEVKCAIKTAPSPLQKGSAFTTLLVYTSGLNPNGDYRLSIDNNGIIDYNDEIGQITPPKHFKPNSEGLIRVDNVNPKGLINPRYDSEKQSFDDDDTYEVTIRDWESFEELCMATFNAGSGDNDEHNPSQPPDNFKPNQNPSSSSGSDWKFANVGVCIYPKGAQAPEDVDPKNCNNIGNYDDAYYFLGRVIDRNFHFEGPPNWAGIPVTLRYYPLVIDGEWQDFKESDVKTLATTTTDSNGDFKIEISNDVKRELKNNIKQGTIITEASLDIASKTIYGCTEVDGRDESKIFDPETKRACMFFLINERGAEGISPNPPPLPCVEGWGNDAKTQKITIEKNDSEKEKNDKLLAIKYCTKVDTALGSLEVTPLGLISNLLRWLLGIAGSASLIIFLYAGYVLMTSAGNKEKVQGARETITSAIVGLIFIIFSVAILEFIGVDILQIPGLGK